MKAVEGKQVLGTRRTRVVIALVLGALLASLAIALFVRFAAAPPATAAPTQHAAAIAPGDPVGDAWWQDPASQVPVTAAVGHQWWHAATAAPRGTAAILNVWRPQD